VNADAFYDLKLAEDVISVNKKWKFSDMRIPMKAFPAEVRLLRRT
jgi:hypothetical protein